MKVSGYRKKIDITVYQNLTLVGAYRSGKWIGLAYPNTLNKKCPKIVIVTKKKQL